MHFTCNPTIEPPWRNTVSVAVNVVEHQEFSAFDLVTPRARLIEPQKQ